MGSIQCMIMYVVFTNVTVMSMEQAYHSWAQKDEKQREGRTSGPLEPFVYISRIPSFSYAGEPRKHMIKPEHTAV